MEFLGTMDPAAITEWWPIHLHGPANKQPRPLNANLKQLVPLAPASFLWGNRRSEIEKTAY
jgi:hypothetical protein